MEKRSSMKTIIRSRDKDKKEINKLIVNEERMWLTGFIVYSTSWRSDQENLRYNIVSNLCFGLTAWVFDGVPWCMTWCQVPILWECHESGFCARCKISLIWHAVWTSTRHTLTNSPAAGFEWWSPITSASESFESAFKWLYPR